jgi:nucleoside recognition membrane protein YjiH
MTPAPPPLPKNEDPFWDGFRVYLRAFVFLLPSFFMMGFVLTFIFPRVKQLWEDTGLDTSPAKWLMEWVETLMHHSVFIALGIAVLLLVSELTWAGWRRYRRFVVTAFTLLVHTAVLAWIAAIALEATLAAPVLAHNKVKELKAKAEQGSTDHP